MKQFLVLVLICWAGIVGVLAQNKSGAQALRLAQSIYEQGRLHELQDLPGLDPKVIPKYSKAEQVSAYRLLTLAYIYLEEPEKADVAMLSLLDADHFYEPNANVEPAEFMGLYKTFRTKPVFGVGIKFGGNFTFPLLNSVYYVTNSAPANGQYSGNGKYTTKFGFQFGLVFEKEIFGNSKSKFLRKVTFTPELFYTTRSFSYSNSSPFYDDITGAPDGTQSVIAKQNWLDINPVFQLKMSKTSILNPYVGLGPGASYLMSAPYTLVTKRTNVNGSESGPAINLASSFKKLMPSVIGSAGIKYRFGSIYLLAELRIQYFLMNPVKASARSSVTASLLDYAYVPSDFKPLSLTANIGFVFPYFNPIKIKRK